jgi:peptidoglycan hydrolase CwlO-like protein
MPKFLRILLCLSTIVVMIMALPIPRTYSDELDDINKQINELTTALNQSVAATKPLESQMNSMQSQIQGIKNRVVSIESDMVVKKKNIDDGYKNLTTKERLFNQTVRDYYIKSYYNTPLQVFFSAGSASEITQILAYQRAKTNQDKSIITSIALTITDLEQRKVTLEDEQKRLVSLKANLDQQTTKLASIVNGAKAYQQDVSGKLASLTAKQQEIMAARNGNFTFSIGSGELADEYLSSIKGFRETAPAGSFAIFSFGGYTHRNGMSQYGARGRAQAGQNYQAILSAYYPGTNLETKGDLPGEINVRGFGTMSFEDRYLLGIAEMPSTWHPDALKAQAVAARTYAYRNRDMSGGICTDEGCQVFSSSKADNSPQAWKDAVQATRGQILTKDGQPVSTQYASTHGGFINTSGWDTTDGQGGSNFIDKSYEKAGGSPWLYKAWWRKGYSNSGDTCGRSNPWLSGQELADIVNAAIALRNSGGIDTGRITPVTTSCWGGNPYSMDDLRNLVANKGGISSANSVTVSQGNGITNNVTINGVSLSGLDFKRAVCLRAPGYIRIPQSDCESGWTFFNIEQR